MFTGCRVEAAVRQNKSLYGTTSDQMGGNDLIDIRFRDIAIPDSLRIYDHGWPMFALVQTAGLIDANATLETGSIHCLLETSL